MKKQWGCVRQAVNPVEYSSMAWNKIARVLDAQIAF
jgi:hypothetical protein